MPKKKTSVPHCPNCGAPVSLDKVVAKSVRCEYCGSFVDVADFLPPPAPVVPRYEPSPPSKPVYTPPPKQKSDGLSPGLKFLIELGISAIILFCVFPLLLRGCFPHI